MKHGLIRSRKQATIYVMFVYLQERIPHLRYPASSNQKKTLCGVPDWRMTFGHGPE